MIQRNGCHSVWSVYNGLQIEAKGRMDVEAGRHPHLRGFQNGDGSPFSNGRWLPSSPIVL